MTLINVHPNGLFSGDYISALRGCCALKFLHTLEIGKGLLAHTRRGTGVTPQKTLKFTRMGLCFTRDVYFFRHSFSEVPRPIALKLCHMVGIWRSFIMPLQKLGALPPKNWGPKTCKISVNFGPLQILIANISGTAEDIQNRPALQTMAIPPAFNEKCPVNCSPLTAWNYM